MQIKIQCFFENLVCCPYSAIFSEFLSIFKIFGHPWSTQFEIYGAKYYIKYSKDIKVVYMGIFAVAIHAKDVTSFLVQQVNISCELLQVGERECSRRW